MVDAVVAWWKDRTEILFEILEESQFYAQIYKIYLQRGGYGTALMYTDVGRSGRLHCRSFPIGSYTLEEDAEGNPDTVQREFLMSAREMFNIWGEKAGAQVIACAEAEQFSEREKKFPVLHVVRRRYRHDPRKAALDAKERPWSSVYVNIKEKVVLSEGGYFENPYSVTRYHLSSFSPYGWAPGFLALPDSRQLNFLEKMLDANVEKRVDPPLLVPANMADDDINIQAGGITPFNPWLPAQGQPREWALSNDIRSGEERAARKRQAIEQLYHVDLFQMFSTLEGSVERTAREIAERSNEKLTQFYPTFALFTQGFLNQFMKRALQLSFEIEPPTDVPQQALIEDEAGFSVPDPAISYISPLALALKKVHNASLIATMQGLEFAYQLHPDMADHLNWDKIGRDYPRNQGLPEKWVTPLKQVEEIRAARAEEQRRMQEAAMAAEGAKALGATKGMPVEEIEEKVASLAQ